MKNLFKILSLTLTILFCNSNVTNAQCHIDDWTALKALYESTDGDNWDDNTGWEEVTGNSPTTLCNLENLYGVDLDVNGRVSKLDLNANELNGNIPLELGNLSNLTSLALRVNELIGNIPPELRNLSNLTSLSLSDNELSDDIPPELGNLINLTYLSLSNNELSNNIPPELGNLSNLAELHLYLNNLSGNIPPELGNLSNLTDLSLYLNNFSGNIPPELGNLSNLTTLDLAWNDLSGNVPPELENLNNLTFLSLSHNDLIGNIPPELGNLSNLTYLTLRFNEFSGNIPPELENLNNLTFLSLSDNDLIGNIPPELGNLSNLTYLNLKVNELNGNIPPELGNLSNLTRLYLDNNELINGNIPPELGNLSKLTDLHLQNNELSGNIPPELGDLSNLIFLSINNNNLSGCFDNNLTILCSQLNSPSFDGNADISAGNYFDAPWEDFCASNVGGCTAIPPNPVNANVWPGDKNHDGIVDQKDVAIAGYLYETGPARTPEHQNIEWYGHPAQDWADNLPFNGANIKHLDCNGDGTISTGDANAVIQNLGLTHDDGGNQIGTFDFENTNYQIYLQPIDNLANDNFLEVNVVLENKNGNNLNLQGGYFTIDYNNVNTNITNAAMNFTNSWLGSPSINMIESFSNFPNTQQIEIGFSKTDGTNSTGKGVIGQLTFVLDNNAARSANDLLDFEVIEIGVHDMQGNIQPIEEQFLQVGLSESNCQSNWTITEDSPFYNVYKSNGTIETDGFVLVGKEQQVQYIGNKTRLNEGFSVRKGADFRAGYGSCN